MWSELGTIGTMGSEDGIIQKDEEYDGSARITLETCPRYGANVYAITCGVYGSMVHTTFGSGNVIQGKYDSMKTELQCFVDKMSALSEDDCQDFYCYFTKKY